MKKNTYMHFEEESIFYIWSKFQLNTCMFDSNILLTKFGTGFWFRFRALVPGFIRSLLAVMNERTMEDCVLTRCPWIATLRVH